MNEDILSRILEIEDELHSLPTGAISKKRIKNKEYFYYRWTENKKRKEKYVPKEEVVALMERIERRKALEKELARLENEKRITKSHEFLTDVYTGKSLRDFSISVKGYKKRECYQRLYDYVHGNTHDKVLILYGLRRTGKTTMIRQALLDMDDREISKTAFIQVSQRNTIADINKDLRYLEENGFKYIFIDEATLMEDFIEGSAIFSDLFASRGMKIILSGTDSLGFIFSEDEQLYDRCIFIHTTFIPYREFENVLGLSGIDEYIRYGGTMSLSGIKYNEDSIFASGESTNEYIDSAIARNIQHSLKCYQDEAHFRLLQELYEKNELTSAINRVVEDINHRFTLEVLTRDFHSSDLSLSARNLRHDRFYPNDILDRIDISSVTERLRQLLEIRNKVEQKVKLDESHTKEIEEYLYLLDLIQYVDVVSLSNINKKRKRTIISQPGMRFAQAKALIESLLLDEKINDLSLYERNIVLERILNEIKGRMLEDIVLLETRLANPKKDVFVLQFPVGEFDMVIFDSTKASCTIFEIKHSLDSSSEQYRHLIDKEKCLMTEHRYGKIVGKYVLYRGEDRIVDNIQYLNVEKYLKGLSSLNS